jgi:hypothetical protein
MLTQYDIIYHIEVVSKLTHLNFKVDMKNSRFLSAIFNAKKPSPPPPPPPSTASNGVNDVDATQTDNRPPRSVYDIADEGMPVHSWRWVILIVNLRCSTLIMMTKGEWMRTSVA